MQSTASKLQRQRWLSRWLGLIVCASLMLSSVAAVPFSAPAQDPTPAVSAEPAAAAAQDEIPTDSSRVNYHRIVVKFAEGADVSLQGEGLVSASGADLSPVQQTLQGLDVSPVFSTAAKAMDQARASASASTETSLPALDQYFYINLAPEATFEESVALLQKLMADPSVELAHMEPIYTPATRLQIAADLSGSQGYLRPAANGGIDAQFAWTITGGRGINVQLTDVEAGWIIGHEDLPLKNADLIESTNSSDSNWINHGAAVVGVIAGKNNGTGITGIASDTYVRMVSTVNFLTPDAILKAATYSRPGDIILISEQALGPLSEETCPDGCDCKNFENVPVEYWQENYDAIYTATQLGVIVVEAAGNGAMNLEADRYKSYFKRSFRDSGAILVGAGTPDTTHAPVCDANYAARIDLQGWGADVVTAGYGDQPASGEDTKQSYTDTFGGTSAASAMVAGAVSSLQGIAKKRGYLLTPSQMRSILRTTGTAQGDVTEHHIGPLPNLRRAIEERLTLGVTLLSPADNSTVRTLKPTLVWQAYYNATNYQIQVATNSTFSDKVVDTTSTATEIVSPVNLKSSVPTYYWRVRPFVNELWEGWGSNVFRFSVVAESAPAVTLSKPASGELITNSVSFRPQFTWKEPKPIPDGYEIQISTNYDLSGGTDVFVTENLYIPPAPGLTVNSRYYWRVRSYIGTPPDDASFGPWTSRRVLYTSLSIAGIGPLSLSANEDTLRPTFSWSVVSDARAYQLQATKYTSFSKINLNATVPLPSNGDPVPTEYTPRSDLPRAADMQWRVRVKGLYGWSSWSDVDTFTTLNPPSTPALLSPGNKAAVSTWQTGVLMTWSKPGKNPDTFQIQIATDKNFEDIMIDEDGIPLPDPADEIKVPNYTAVGLDPENVYYWRVRAINDGASNWSAVRIFYTTPPAPTGLSVESNDSLRPTFAWEKVDIARSYQIQIARDNPDIPDENKYKLFAGTRLLVNEYTYTSPPYMISKSLPRTNPDTEPDKSFIWRVRSGGLYGYSAWSEIATVTTPNPPNTPVLNSPGNGANISNFTPTLDWLDSAKISGNLASNAIGYQLQVSNRSNFVIVDTDNDILLQIDEDVLIKSSYQLGPSDLPKAGTYFWRVRAVNENSEYSIWSSVWSFKTPAMVSGTITDALTGDPLANVTVQVNGRLMSTTTDRDGNYVIRGMPAGDFTLVASVSGYMRQSVRVSTNYATNRVRNIDMASVPDAGQIRIVLTWGGTPADLDAHLWLPPTNKAHIYKDNPGSDTVMAEMERTDSDGFGPEIITLSGTFSGKYVFAAYTPAAVDQLAISRARVTVYNGSDMIANFAITDAGSGHWWKAFTMDGSTHKITIQNVITNTSPAPYADTPTP